MYYKNNYKQTSFPLITTNSNHQYQINQEAVKFIKNIPQPIAVISVAGLYRTGKSYLLNRVLLNRSDGFHVGPTVNPCTKGLWIWGKPIIGRNKNNQLVNVLIIDSEGFGAVYQDANHDARIFALTLLLSSCFLYNSVGSIDQMALQNVSLVTNIAKSIRQKNKQNENQTENLLENFPQFYWILRDFTLQLITGEGKQITAKQYLQKALQVTSKDPNDDKSKIRKALTTYFQERDCITLVRPLTNQQNLQELDRMEFQKLRPQFVQQIILMRKKILNSLRIKKFYGKAIDGEIFCQIVEKYVNIINNGAVPNIQNIWTYISKNQCQKAKHEAMLYFQQNINQRIVDKMPLIFQQLEQIANALKKSILTQFKKKIVNFDNTKQIKNQLQSLMNKRILELKKQNEKESRKQLQRCVQLEFQVLERKIKSGDFKSIAEMHHQIEKYAKQFNKNAPIKGILGNSILNEFLIRKIFEGSENMMRIRDTEIDKLRNGIKDNQKKYQNEIRQLKNQLNSLKNSTLIKINKLETQKSQLLSRQQTLKQAYNDLKAEKDKLEQTIQNESRREKSLSTKAYQQVRSKISVYENQAEAYERKIFLLNSECQKKQALLNQKIEFQEKIIDELKKKEEKSYEELKNMKETFGKQLKQANSRTDNSNKSNQRKMNELSEKISEYENEIHRLTQQLKIEKQQNEKSYSENSSKFEELNKTINKLNIQNREKQMFYRNKLAQKSNDDSRLTDKINFLEDSLKDKEQTIKNLKLQINKGKAILNQKQQFYEVEIQELKKKYEEQITKNQSIFKLLQNKQNQKSQIMSQIRNQYMNEIQKIQKSNQQEKKTLKNQLYLLNEKKNQIENNLNNQIDQLRKELNMLNERYESVEETKNKLFEQNKQNDIEKMKCLKLSQQRNGAIIKGLEKQIENMKQQATQESREIQRKNQEALSQLKNFYEIQKERLEKKILQYQQKYKDFNQKNSQERLYKMQEKLYEYEKQIQELNYQLKQNKLSWRNIQNQYQCKLTIITREVESLREQKEELKDSLSTTKSTLEQEYSMIIANLKHEKSDLMSKIQQMNIEFNRKQKQLFTFSHKKEYLEMAVNKKDVIIENIRSELEAERKSHEVQFDKLKQKLQKVNQEYLQFKIQNEKALALSNQENQFLHKKITQLSEQREKQRQRTQEKLNLAKNQTYNDFKQRNQKLQSQLNSSETKFQKNKKLWKEEQIKLNKMINLLQKEKFAFQEKINQLQAKKEQESHLHQNQNQIYTNQILELRQQTGKEKQKLVQEIEKYKYLCAQLEEAKCQVENNYQKDKELFQNKLRFVQSQKQQAKTDLNQAMKKFEVALDQMNRSKPSNENLEDITKSLQKKYTYQIESLKESYEKRIQQGQQKNKQITSELRNIKQIYNDLKNEKELQSQRQKMQMIHMNQLSHLTHLQNSSQQHEKQKLEYQERLLRQKQEYVKRINELEKKIKEYETKSNNITFGFQKQYVKWNIDRKCLQDRIEDLMQANQKMYRELQRFKNKEKDKERDKHSTRRLFRLE